MPSLKNSAGQKGYLYEMMQRLGIEASVVPRLGLAYMTEFHRCQTCPAKVACREWLDVMPQSVASASHFCPCDDILFELRINQPGRVSITVDQHACVADLERFVAEINEHLLQKADDDTLALDLKSRKARLCEEIQWLRRKSLQNVFDFGRIGSQH
jgi:hypothetical protein